MQWHNIHREAAEGCEASSRYRLIKMCQQSTTRKEEEKVTRTRLILPAVACCCCCLFFIFMTCSTHAFIGHFLKRVSSVRNGKRGFYFFRSTNTSNVRSPLQEVSVGLPDVIFTNPTSIYNPDFGCHCERFRRHTNLTAAPSVKHDFALSTVQAGLLSVR